jgi:hypothetical protein
MVVDEETQRLGIPRFWNNQQGD